MAAAIRIQNISKRYFLNGGRRLFSKSPADAFMALSEISFDVPVGQTVGIIGRNGAGKSTLLKILSRVTRPTGGRIEAYGRMASLLEVGTGFHPELSGRENVFLNGAILGMRRAQIRARFDEIVQFAGVEKFLDTPVKHYSSGMYVRLAFAVAAHLEPDILVVDEVLAVGDSAFQKRCIGKMKSISQGGRTVIFVSHSLAAVRKLCERTILLDEGRLVADGATMDTLAVYNKKLIDEEITIDTQAAERLSSCSGRVRFTSFHLRGESGEERTEFWNHEKIKVWFSYKVCSKVSELIYSFALRSDTTDEVVTNTRYILSSAPLEAGFCGSVCIEIPKNSLYAREYHPYLWLGDADGHPYDRITYSQDSCRPILVHSNDEEFLRLEGYFPLPLTMTHETIQGS